MIDKKYLTTNAILKAQRDEARREAFRWYQEAKRLYGIGQEYDAENKKIKQLLRELLINADSSDWEYRWYIGRKDELLKRCYAAIETENT